MVEEFIQQHSSNKTNIGNAFVEYTGGRIMRTPVATNLAILIFVHWFT